MLDAQNCDKNPLKAVKLCHHRSYIDTEVITTATHANSYTNPFWLLANNTVDILSFGFEKQIGFNIL